MASSASGGGQPREPNGSMIELRNVTSGTGNSKSSRTSKSRSARGEAAPSWCAGTPAPASRDALRLNQPPGRGRASESPSSSTGHQSYVGREGHVGRYGEEGQGREWLYASRFNGFRTRRLLGEHDAGADMGCARMPKKKEGGRGPRRRHKTSKWVKIKEPGKQVFRASLSGRPSSRAWRSPDPIVLHEAAK